MPSSATITSFYTFSANTKARAVQVNDNFSVFRGHLLPVAPNTATATNNTHDLGSTEWKWRTIYGWNFDLDGTSTLQIRGGGNDFVFQINSTTVAKIDSTGFNTAYIPALGITTTLIGTTSITEAKLFDSAVTTVKIADANVTMAKLATSNNDSGGTVASGNYGSTADLISRGVSLQANRAVHINFVQNGGRLTLDTSAPGDGELAVIADGTTIQTLKFTNFVASGTIDIMPSFLNCVYIPSASGAKTIKLTLTELSGAVNFAVQTATLTMYVTQN